MQGGSGGDGRSGDGIGNESGEVINDSGGGSSSAGGINSGGSGGIAPDSSGGGTSATHRKNVFNRQKAKDRKVATALVGGEANATGAQGIEKRLGGLEKLVRDTLEATKRRLGPSEMRKDHLLKQLKKKNQRLKRNRREDRKRWQDGEPAPDLSDIQPRFTKSTASRGGARRHAYYGRLAQVPKSGGNGPSESRGGGDGRGSGSAKRTRQTDAAAGRSRVGGRGGRSGVGGGGGGGGGQQAKRRKL